MSDSIVHRVPAEPPRFRQDCFEAHSLRHLRELGPLASHLDSLVDMTFTDASAFPRCLIVAQPGSGKAALTRTIARDLAVPWREVNCAPISHPQDLIDRVQAAICDDFAGVLHLARIDCIDQRLQPCLAKLMADEALGPHCFEHNGGRGWLVEPIPSKVTLLASAVLDEDMIPGLRTMFDMRIGAQIPASRMRCRARRGLTACGVRPTAGAIELTAALLAVDPGCSLPMVRAMVLECRREHTAELTRQMVEKVAHDLGQFLASEPWASSDLGVALEKGRARAERADAQAMSLGRADHSHNEQVDAD